MYSQNVQAKIEGQYFVLRMQSPELIRLYDKFSGRVHVKIQKPQSSGTEQQNRAKHALETAFWLSGLHSAPEDVKSLEQFKFWLKSTIGIFNDQEYKGVRFRQVKLWEHYTKEERGNFITALISTIEQAGAMIDPKIQEIIKGMEQNSLSGEA